jgi:hypothetical protein
VDSWPFTRHRVRRGTLFLSAQLRRPQSHPSSCQPQLRRPHSRGEEQHRPQPSVPPGLIPSVRFRSNGPDRGYRFAHACLTPWLACQRRPQPSVFPWSDPLRPIQIARLGPRVPLRARAPDALARLSAPKPPGAGPARSARSPPLSLTLHGLPVSARPPTRAPSVADLVLVVGFRSDG